ncbi:unnamed protein product [Lactuca saligna]|uniref:Protein kinase domain-containing protein n=1 Tax=Lactuca saligna TaxID=75948 RepID=A0AA36E5N7_LACSI|nr:unnamed protein product [Lactuca saligna]
MENGSLNDWLRDLTCQESQTWNNRIRIALDVAKGLQYLHNFANPTYVHKDINSSNILLTKDLRAKISKFGLTKSTEKGENVNSSIKCRSESKGIDNGKKAVYENDDDGGQVMLCEEVVPIMGDGNNAKSMVNYIIDPRLKVRHALGFVIDQDELALRLVKLSIGCLESEASRRLCMNEIVSTLMMIQMDPQRLGTMFLV